MKLSRKLLGKIQFLLIKMPCLVVQTLARPSTAFGQPQDADPARVRSARVLLLAGALAGLVLSTWDDDPNSHHIKYVSECDLMCTYKHTRMYHDFHLRVCRVAMVFRKVKVHYIVHGDIKKIYSPWLKMTQFCTLSSRALSSQELDTAESFSGFAGDFRQSSVLDRFSQSTTYQCQL